MSKLTTPKLEAQAALAQLESMANTLKLHSMADKATIAELKDALTNLLMVVGNHTGEEIKCDTVTEKKIITRARKLTDSTNE